MASGESLVGRRRCRNSSKRCPSTCSKVGEDGFSGPAERNRRLVKPWPRPGANDPARNREASTTLPLRMAPPRRRQPSGGASGHAHRGQIEREGPARLRSVASRVWVARGLASASRCLTGLSGEEASELQRIEERSRQLDARRTARRRTPYCGGGGLVPPLRAAMRSSAWVASGATWPRVSRVSSCRTGRARSSPMRPRISAIDSRSPASSSRDSARGLRPRPGAARGGTRGRGPTSGAIRAP